MIRFGIIGTGRIAKRFIKELEHVEGASVSCVYNPHGIRAKEFVARLQDEIAEDVPTAVNGLSRYPIPEAHSELEDVWNKIDAVYIASPHATHIEYTIEALSHGKHVLCEKPMALKKEDIKVILGTAKEKGLVLMEGLKTAYMPGFKSLIETAKSGVIGDIVHVRATFTKLVDKDGREYTDKDAAGSFIELGSYGMLAVFSLLGTNYKKVSFKTIKSEDGVDIFTVADFEYENNFGEAATGIGVKSEGSLIISGTKGYIVVPAPWWLTKHYEVHFEDPNKILSYDNELKGDGLRYEIREFIKQVNDRKSLSDIEKISLAMAGVFEEYKK
ncbi:Gfo/Idh/MocA family protein [Pseudobutyrivibrio sp. MD2005]|uniref:Gfo/Idh/MocA family protein n=1 Tax=Pseudobutyrivibrio sp. MD2005 TaxID=1410616 RepID=UPI00056A5BBC|nr:Gfo/Idh/MocA family oxidoreductase [Pseudobutyrivibrio sp. MD2005]